MQNFHLAMLLSVKSPEVTLNTYLIMLPHLVHSATEVKVFQWIYNPSQKILRQIYEFEPWRVQ